MWATNWRLILLTLGCTRELGVVGPLASVLAIRAYFSLSLFMCFSLRTRSGLSWGLQAVGVLGFTVCWKLRRNFFFK